MDFVVTDPPYGIGEDGAKNNTRGNGKIAPTIFTAKNWDKKRPDPLYFELMRACSKNQIIFGGNYFADLLPPSSNWIVWDKMNAGSDFADCELAWCSMKGAVRKIEYLWNGMLQGNMKNKEKRVHPTQKPLPVMEWIIQRYTKEGDTVLDPFMGSGTTCIACKKLGRNYIGVEKDEEYFEIAQKRMEEYFAQQSLFW